MAEKKSSFIETIAYIDEDNSLILKFKSGRMYEYGNVPKSVYKEMMAAESKGKFYNSRIKGQFKGEEI